MKARSTVLREELVAVVDELLLRIPEGEPVTLDAIGEAIGTRAVSQVEIDAILDVVEGRGRRVQAESGGDGEAHLRRVLEAARALLVETGRRPTTQELAERSGLAAAQVRHALWLARIMQR